MHMIKPIIMIICLLLCIIWFLWLCVLLLNSYRIPIGLKMRMLMLMMMLDDWWWSVEVFPWARARQMLAENDVKHEESKTRETQRQEKSKEQATPIIRAGQQTGWARRHKCSRQRQPCPWPALTGRKMLTVDCNQDCQNNPPKYDLGRLFIP